MKKNDWIVANINNPDFNESDFKNALDLNLSNTLFLPMEDYLDSKFIKENDLFKDSSGKFNKKKFEDFYKESAAKFANFQEESSLDDYEYGFWDTHQKPTSKVKNPNFKLETTLNPDHVSTGVIGPNMTGERYKTPFELAEKQKIYDWEKGTFTNETPEDYALFTNPIKFFKKMFTEPLVLAEYQYDEVDPITGELHYKGEKKLNDLGEYYFETLSGRSIVGKKVLSLGDIITKEDSLINKYDFFDSDDMLKSTAGVIAKNLAVIAPMAIGPISGWYSGFYIAREIAKSLPMLNSILGMFGEYEDPKLLNTIAGIGEQLTGGTSEYAQNKMFSFENFGNLIADVALQWGQQKLIANSLSRVKNNSSKIVSAAESKAALEYEKRAQDIWNRAYNNLFDIQKAKAYTNAEGFDGIKAAVSSGSWKQSSVGAAAILKFVPEAEKAFSRQALLGLDLSLVYMAIISNYDVYNDALAHGATKSEAAAVALGSTIGMFCVDKYAHLGEIFFDETPQKAALRSLRQGIKDEAEELSKRIGTNQVTRGTTKEGLVGIIKKSAEKASNFVKNYHSGLKHHTLGFVGKSFGEGLEELSEEVVTDISKSLYQLAGQFGWVSLTDIGAWDNMKERYLMSLFGGAIGGGLFYGVDAIRSPKSVSDRNTQKELLYLVSLGKTNEILDNLKDMKDKGKLASTELSIDTVNDTNGNKVFLTADESHKSQNDYVYDIMKNSILQMESILNEHGLNLNEDQLFEKMVLRNHRYMALKDNLFDKSYITLYYDDYQQIVSDIYNIETEILKLKDSTKDDDKRNENSEFLEKLLNLELKKQELLKRKDSFLKGEYNLDYVDKMLFYIHPDINLNFYSSLFELWVQERYHKDVTELSEGELKKYSEEWEKLKKTKGKQFLDEAFRAYKKVRTDIEKGLQEVSNNDVLKWGELLALLKKDSVESFEIGPNDRIPSKEIDIEEFLDSLGVIKTSEYDKPLEKDPSKVDKAFLLQLEEDSSAAFEIIKDNEEGYWSIYFKTPRTLNPKLKQRLFLAAAAVIPEGDKLSTLGELTKGGASGINRFGQLDFLGGIEFEQVGTREVYLRNVYSGLSTDELKTELEKQTSSISDEKVLDRNLYYNIELINSELQKLGEEGFDLSKYSRSDKESTNYMSKVEIPIWQKTITGESEEDFNDRKTQREGESDEAFKQRRIARENKRRLYNQDNFIKNILKFLNVNDIIDRSTYRLLMAELGLRSKDILGMVINLFITLLNQNLTNLNLEGITIASLRKEFYTILEEALNKLHPDFSNREEVLEEIIVKTRKLREEEFDKRNSHRKVVLDAGRLETLLDPDGEASFETIEKIDTLLADEEVSLDRIIEDINLLYPKLRISITENPDLKEGISINEFKESFYIMLNGENSPLFNKVIETAVKIHNLQIDTLENNIDNSELISELALTVLEDSLDSGRVLLVDGSSNPGGYEYEKNEVISRLEVELEKELNLLLDDIISNEELLTLNELKRKATLNLNPVVKILKAVLPKLGEDFGDIEETLETIYNQFESLDIPTSFTLTPKQLEALRKVEKHFGYISAVIRAAKTKSSYFNFLPYNNSLNLFIKDNRDVIKDVEELLELDEDLANVIEESFAHFDKEISLWIRRSEKGTINKREMFSKFDLSFNKARLDFFNQIKDQCKVGEKDLFKGFEHIDVDKPEAIVEIEKLVYNNFKNQGWTESEFISILSKLVITDKVIKQDSGIGKSLDLLTFTDYDKFILLTSLVACDPVDFYEFYKDYVLNSRGKEGQKLAPLTFQEYNIKLGFIHKNSMGFINNILSEYAKINKINLSILENAVIINGIAGAGKTDIVVRALQDSNSVWVSGPSDTLIDSLKKIIPHAETFGHTELFSLIIGSKQYTDILSETTEATNKKKEDLKNVYEGKYIKSNKDDEFASLKIDEIKFITKDSPKQLVIDEITLFSNIELLLLSKWAKLTGTLLVFAGDNHQNGDKSIGFNIAPECTFAFRTPEMNISLRDANIWKYKNQLELVLQINELDSYTGKELDLFKKYLSNFNFHYYFNGDKFTGELVTDKLEDSIISTLDGTIGFIGDTSSSSYQKLKGLGKNIEVYKSVDEIQGKEFDYVISDIDLSYNPVEGFSERYNISNYLNTLYTIITRSKKGTILIDNGLTNTIQGSTLEKYSSDNIGITPEITELYIEEKTNFLNSLNLKREIPLEVPEEPLTEGTVIEGEEYEEQEKELEEPEPETENDSYLDIEALLETIIPVYGNLNLSGLERISSGKLRKVDNRDLGIFLDDGAEIEIKDRPKENLFLLKSIILFDKIDDYWYHKLNGDITKKFSLEELLKIKYYILAEDYNPETHRLLTKEAGYEEGKQVFSINGTTKLFTLVGVIEKNGELYEITLGGLSNPETLRKNAKDIVNPKTNKKIKGTITRIKERALATTDPELKKKLEKYADTYDDKVDYYENLLRELISNSKWAVSEGKSRWRIRKPSFDRCTRILLMKHPDGTPRYTPLNKYFDLNTELYVVSPIYTLVNRNDGKDEIIPGLDDKHKGKPVIFVSSFKLHSPTELVLLYSDSKSGKTSENYPEVRKIILDPRGVFFGDLIDGKIKSVGDNETLVFPFATLALGFRMYTCLWNFRARITKFNEAVDKFIKDNNLSESELDQLTIEESRNPGSTDSKFDILRKLNDYLEEQNVQLFRLGYSEKNGFYSRKINDSTNGTFINRLMAKDYLLVIDLLFKNVINEIIPPPSASTIKSIIGKTSDFDKQKAGESWVKKLLGKTAINISLKSDDSEEIVKFEAKDIDLLKSLPLNLVKICKNLRFALQFNGGVSAFRQLLQDDPDVTSWWNIKKKDLKTGEDTYLDYMSIVDGLTGGLKDVDPINTLEGPGIRTYKEGLGTYDRRILNLFELIFHGKIGNDLVDEDKEVKGGFPADGTLFKHGIFVDTFYVKGEYSAFEAFKVVTVNKDLYRTNALPSSPVLKIDITPWDGKEEGIQSEEKTTKTNSELDKINKKLNTSFSNIEEVTTFIDLNRDDVFKNSTSNRELRKKYIEFYFDNNTNEYVFKTLFDIIKEEIGVDASKLESNKDESGVLYVFKDGEKEYLISLSGKNIIIQNINEGIEDSENPSEEFTNRFKSIIKNQQDQIDIIRERIDEESGNANVFDKYIEVLSDSRYDKDTLKELLDEFINFLKDEDEMVTPEISLLLNELNKIKCNE